MATVVGIDKARLKQTTCSQCASIIEYSDGEVRTLWSGIDSSGGPDGAKGFTCPKCGSDVITHRW